MAVKVYKRENDVKKRIRELLDKHKWFHWASAAGSFSTGGIADRHALRGGCYMAIEAKFDKSDKPTALQRGFLQSVNAENGMAFCVDRVNIEDFARYLELFDLSIERHRAKQNLTPEEGAEFLEVIRRLTEKLV